ncbi:MAG: hypothetical protein A2600_02470 [Candidatus Lambdaproteobacteria bacterium RIFOXYD1_FULL_56_27]|uniref:PilZ domain-containing protein n=1 Tax=Candidatus Lambdaproteobacteria bacterium RIFOXYD2_FULL_56_26 TaxID=1817773 RepID=A0A1F6H2N3_9PROT|nr:MAG: hypothetical protein A2426_09510 [Candidatus Lambdaproteobacteria bacterium RIFOXYC1_FULL_56_13]OGH04643.1 MAG: hypothetical protein A2557_06535 [Candidatus Lambdaproteobacteria bacterium RIFOXYD2_FULL_56_26]OGH09107.1 MAG: hypothetical protein A2600_02470 [Candidatus Lambdaproteobacteria bacterium RIFOXYD1_FULL_56_27]
MFSIKATYEGGRFQLQEPLHYQGVAKVIVTLLEPKGEEEIEVLPENADRLSAEELRALRKHERFQAHGSIAIQMGEAELFQRLFDYSSGGLSFLSNRPFPKGRVLTASLKDPLNARHTILEFEFEVARSVAHGQGFKIGCKFTDQVDEALWHSLMRTQG